MAPVIATSAYTNKTDEHFVFSPEELPSFIETLATHGGEGRVFYLGFILHELGSTWWSAQDGGHIAPIAQWAKKPMYASQFYHSTWSSVDPIPESYRERGESGVEEFLDLVNATSVVTFTKIWAKYCIDRPDKYEQVAKYDRFRVFVRIESARKSIGYFQKGTGVVKDLRNALEVKLDAETKDTEVVLKYRYHPHLKVSPETAEIFEVPVFTEELGGGRTKPYSFIGLRGVQGIEKYRLSF